MKFIFFVVWNRLHFQSFKLDIINAPCYSFTFLFATGAGTYGAEATGALAIGAVAIGAVATGARTTEAGARNP